MGVGVVCYICTCSCELHVHSSAHVYIVVYMCVLVGGGYQRSKSRASLYCSLLYFLLNPARLVGQRAQRPTCLCTLAWQMCTAVASLYVFWGPPALNQLSHRPSPAFVFLIYLSICEFNEIIQTESGKA